MHCLFTVLWQSRETYRIGNRGVILTGQGHRTSGWQTEYPWQQSPYPVGRTPLLSYWLFCAAHLLDICVTGKDLNTTG